MNDLTLYTPGLPAPIRSALKFRVRDVIGLDGQFDHTVVESATLTGSFSEDQLREAIRVIDNVSRPGGVKLAAMALLSLRAVTKSRPGEREDQHASGRVYSEYLATYPADVIQATCRYAADTMPWWPAWADLKAIADRMCAPRIAERRALTEALRRASAKPADAPRPMSQRDILRQRLTEIAALRRAAGDTVRAEKYEAELARLDEGQA